MCSAVLAKHHYLHISNDIIYGRKACGRNRHALRLKTVSHVFSHAQNPLCPCNSGFWQTRVQIGLVFDLPSQLLASLGNMVRQNIIPYCNDYPLTSTQDVCLSSVRTQVTLFSGKPTTLYHVGSYHDVHFQWILIARMGCISLMDGIGISLQQNSYYYWSYIITIRNSYCKASWATYNDTTLPERNPQTAEKAPDICKEQQPV